MDRFHGTALLVGVLLVGIEPLIFAEIKITASDADAGKQFASSVGISSNTIVVGSVGDHHAGASSGSAYVFVQSGTNWSEQAKVTASDAAMAGFFGGSVSIDSNIIVVGSPGSGQSGAVYVFVRSGANWNQEAKLIASDTARGDLFGGSVAISVDSIVVGSLSNDATEEDSGSAYVFVRSGTTWTQQAKLIASDAAFNDQFGSSVTISGDTVVIGSPRNDDAGSSSGSAYVFVRSGSTWTQQAKLTAPDAASQDEFGGSVGISGDTVVIGSPRDDDAGFNSGSAYVFVRNSGAWTQQAKVAPTAPVAGQNFGSSVGISADTIVVGSAGSAFVFVRSGGAWTQQSKLTASDAAAPEAFGSVVGVSGSRAVVGAPFNDDAGDASGSGYIYDLECRLSVTYFNQCDTTWKTSNYDTSTKTICAKGCAMTSLSMALNFFGVTTLSITNQAGTNVVANDPGAINLFMQQHKGDFVGSSVNWAPTTRDASFSQLEWHDARFDSVVDLMATTNFLEKTVCQRGFPVVVGVNLDRAGNPGHFVLVTGKNQANEFVINDPGHSNRTSLTNYNNQFKTRGFVAPTNAVAPTPAPLHTRGLALEDNGALYIGVAPNARLLVNDPKGGRTGIEPNTSNELEEIQQSAQFIDALIDDETGEPPTESAHFVYIDQPINGGDYQVQITGLETGSFELSIRGFARDGKALPPVSIEGVIEAGLTTNIIFTFTPQSAPTVITLSASNITSTGAVLNALINPSGLPTSAWFVWGTTTNYGNTTLPQNLGNGSGSAAASASLTMLSTGTVYHYRVEATNSQGLVVGSDRAFAWSSARPNSFALFTNGVVAFHFTGQAAQRYVVQASTNLIDWLELGVAEDLGGGGFSFHDAPYFQSRFYRVHLP